jgi:hypothetical protein
MTAATIFHPGPRLLRQFGQMGFCCLGLAAAWQWFSCEQAMLAIALGTVALILGALGLVKPTLLRPVFVTWMIAVFPLAWLTTHLLLAILYFGLFTPLAILFRALRRDALALRLRSDCNSYWVTRPATGDARRYFRTF